MWVRGGVIGVGLREGEWVKKGERSRGRELKARGEGEKSLARGRERLGKGEQEGWEKWEGVSETKNDIIFTSSALTSDSLSLFLFVPFLPFLPASLYLALSLSLALRFSHCNSGRPYPSSPYLLFILLFFRRQMDSWELPPSRLGTQSECSNPTSYRPAPRHPVTLRMEEGRAHWVYCFLWQRSELKKYLDSVNVCVYVCAYNHSSLCVEFSCWYTSRFSKMLPNSDLYHKEGKHKTGLRSVSNGNNFIILHRGLLCYISPLCLFKGSGTLLNWNSDFLGAVRMRQFMGAFEW